MSERVTIESIAAGGAGVGRLQDGRVAFVQRTAPGDVVDASAGIVFDGLDTERKLVVFRDRGGAFTNKPY